MHEVVLRAVMTDAMILPIICRIVFQVSFFIMLNAYYSSFI